jgi:predicted metalloendopeptidase
MSIDDAIQKMTDLIKAASASAEIKAAKMSDEEARLSVYAPAGDMQKIKDATFQPAMDMLNTDDVDVQVFVYDKDAPPLKG